MTMQPTLAGASGFGAEALDPTIIYLHIPKTAGTTMAKLLAPRASGSVKSLYTLDEDAWLNTPQAERDACRLVLGHCKFGIHTGLTRAHCYLTMVRDPVQRLVSHYSYVRRSDEHYLQKAVDVRAMSLTEYVSSDLSAEFENDQTRTLSGAAGTAPVTREQYVTALANVRRHIPVLGVTERFRESLAAFAIVLGWKALPTYESFTVSDGKPSPGQLPMEAVEAILERNQYDLLLHRWAQARLDAYLDRNREEIDRLLADLERREQA